MTTPSEIGLPNFDKRRISQPLNQKPNKQTSHELQRNLDSSYMSFCTSSGKKQLNTLQVETKACQLQV